MKLLRNFACKQIGLISSEYPEGRARDMLKQQQCGHYSQREIITMQVLIRISHNHRLFALLAISPPPVTILNVKEIRLFKRGIIQFPRVDRGVIVDQICLLLLSILESVAIFASFGDEEVGEVLCDLEERAVDKRAH